MIKPSIDRLFDFQKFLYDFRSIKRVIHFPNKEIENDIEHSYSLAMTAWYIASYFPELKKDNLIRYALVHDLIEVHAGDTYIYGNPEHLATKPAREAAALEQIKQDWSDFSDMIDDIEIYERHDTPESAFIYALDKIMPIFQIYIADGYTWKHKSITVEMLDSKKRSKVAASPVIKDYYQQLYDLLLKSPHLIAAR